MPLSPSYLPLCFLLFNNTIISSWGLSLCILSLLPSLSFSLLLFLSHPSTHPTSFSITVAWCLLAWRLPTGATGGLRSSDLEQNLSRTNKMLMNDNITATLNRHFSDSLYLCLSLLGNYFLFMIVFFLFVLFQFCVVMQIASLREPEAFFLNHVLFCCMSSGDNYGPCSSTYRHAMGLLFSPVVVCLSDWLCVLFLATRQT